ncbi:uncharacterized protein PHALS_12722 [Plasmopara halstedii]|uniref:Uncharacterized protein n=1 Tax=Plasmopara halstedii TaxID=4781 RepID=A0A0P1AMR3_PLAHL|nr:uncharacterized protein PHALS_12722 [Plasmopara halstedii]CEG42446.1 hypothetical protein PHALS_12722 [Plasmopara halstedii]|eukprot:XP_024578815.1 hypothetical protein PHALS_12722 [Plasmopara halstedii]
MFYVVIDAALRQVKRYCIAFVIPKLETTSEDELQPSPENASWVRSTFLSPKKAGQVR